MSSFIRTKLSSMVGIRVMGGITMGGKMLVVMVCRMIIIIIIVLIIVAYLINVTKKIRKIQICNRISSITRTSLSTTSIITTTLSKRNCRMAARPPTTVTTQTTL